MSLFNKMGPAVGIGAAKVEVAFPRPDYSYGDVIEGALRITGGTTNQSVDAVKLAILEHWETTDSDNDTDHHYRRHSELVAPAVLRRLGDALQSAGAFAPSVIGNASNAQRYVVTAGLTPLLRKDFDVVRLTVADTGDVLEGEMEINLPKSRARWLPKPLRRHWPN